MEIRPLLILRFDLIVQVEINDVIALICINLQP